VTRLRPVVSKLTTSVRIGQSSERQLQLLREHGTPIRIRRGEVTRLESFQMWVGCMPDCGLLRGQVIPPGMRICFKSPTLDEQRVRTALHCSTCAASARR
jgi:hypothetical protein